MKNKMPKILAGALILLTTTSMAAISVPSNVYAAEFSQSSYNHYFDFHDFGTPSIDYTLTSIDGKSVSGSQGSWAIRNPNSSAVLDGRWINTISVHTGGTGGYQNIQSVSINPHLHNKGWVGDNIGSVTGTNYTPYGWAEAVQLKTSDELNNYAYMNYTTVSAPVSWPYLVQSTGDSEASLLANNPNAKNGWNEGKQIWMVNGQYNEFHGNSPGAVGTYADWNNFNMGIGGNWAGTAGYSLPMTGMSAYVEEYPCNVYIDPNGGSWAGTTSTIQAGNVGGQSAIHAGDNLTFKVQPTRTGYEFTGWTLSYTETLANASTCYQQPGKVLVPKINAGNGSAIYNGIDYSAVYDYNYYRSHNSDLAAYYGDNVSMYLCHFILYGMNEGRRASENFDVSYYRDHNADLRSLFGNDLASYYKHYIFNGAIEGRYGNSSGTTYDSYGLYVGNAASVTLKANWKVANYTVHFDGNGATSGSTQDQTMLHDVPAKLNKNGFSRSFQVTYNGNGGTSEKSLDISTSDFRGWLISSGAVNPSYSDEQTVVNIAEPGQTKTLYAAWHDNAVTLPNASKADEYWELNKDSKGWVRYYFTGWYTAPDGGSCVGRGGDAYTPKQDITLYAHWTYNVFVYYDGNTNDGGGMEMTDPAKGDEKTRGVDYIIRENNFTKTGYDFAGWNTAQVDGDGNIVETGLPRFAPGSVYNEDIPLTLFAAWQHRFDIAYMGVCQTEGDDYLDNNGGADYSQLTDTVKLAKSDDLKIQTTKSYVDDEVGTITEDVTATGVGWAFAKDIEAKYPEAYIADDTEYPARDFFVLARDAGAVTYGNVSPDYQGENPKLNSPDMAVANMYRVWDYGPLIKATDRYFTLKQAHDGFITEEELFRSVTAEDDEDGQLVKKTEADVAATGSDEGVTMLNYLAEKWTTFPCAGSATLTYVAKDSAGNVTEYMVTIHITDTKPIDDSGDEDGRVVRGISRKYYNTYQNGDYGWDTYSNYGGLYPDSVWYKDPEYRSCIEEAFSNEENDTPEQIWEFSPEDHAKVKQWIEEHGVGNSKESDGLKKFYEEFSYCRKK